MLPGLLNRAKILCLVSTAALLVNCGGGSTAGVSSTTAVPDTTLPQTSGMDIAYTYNLSSASELDIEIQSTATRSFLSVCEGSSETLDVHTFDYGQCMLRAPIKQLSSKFNLTLPNHINKLIAILWFYDPNKTPLVYRWQRSNLYNGSPDQPWLIRMD